MYFPFKLVTRKLIRKKNELYLAKNIEQEYLLIDQVHLLKKNNTNNCLHNNHFNFATKNKAHMKHRSLVM